MNWLYWTPALAGFGLCIAVVYCLCWSAGNADEITAKQMKDLRGSK